MRGELLCKGLNMTEWNGSSPHAWGTDMRDETWDEISRFIPTCVGNCSQMPGAALCGSVHPHMRGELDNADLFDSFNRGSSPHAWGTAQADGK